MSKEIKDIYRRYQFDQIPTSSTEVLAFHHGGYFRNIDLVPTFHGVADPTISKIRDDLTASGYTCKVNSYRTPEQIERDLFGGFFNIDARRKSILGEYAIFSSKISKVVDGTYKYIPSGCRITRSDGMQQSVVDAVSHSIEEIRKPGPQLIIIDAPAGYGKTTVIYELANSVINREDINAFPLIAELHRNRKVSEFRYVLLSEFDRVFGGIGYELAISKIQSGDIILIIDGFDEMILSGKKEPNTVNDNENEPILTSLMGIIQGQAKVILTSRRTALLDTDVFRRWIQTARSSFAVTQFSILEPLVEQWLGQSRSSLIAQAGIDPSAVENPVILSSLLNMDDEAFRAAIASSDKIVDIFLNRLLAREIERQALQLTPDQQRKIFRELAWRFVELQITEEQRSLIEELVKMDNLHLLETSRALSTEINGQMSLDEYMAKLSIHALLDFRQDSERVSFINEFLFGYLIADYVDNSPIDDLVLEKGYLDILSSSVRSCSEQLRTRLTKKLSFCLDILETETAIKFDLLVARKICRPIRNAYFDGVSFDIAELGNHPCSNTTFANCRFFETIFLGNTLVDLTFINCTFWNCDWEGSVNAQIHGGNWEPKSLLHENDHEGDSRTRLDLKLIILERFWPQGRSNLTARKQLSSLQRGLDASLKRRFDDALGELCHDDFLSETDKESYLVNVDKLGEIKRMLNR